MRNVTFIMVGSFLVMVMLLLYTYNVLQSDTVNIESCKDFNGREFLLSGGTGTPQTYDDIVLEFRRLDWLCSGGNS